MQEMTELSEDEFVDRFKPVANHLNKNASFDWGDGYGTLFETYGRELEYVRKHDVKYVWTLCSADDGDYILSGYHFVNRMGYFITESPAPDQVDVEVLLTVS